MAQRRQVSRSRDEALGPAIKIWLGLAMLMLLGFLLAGCAGGTERLVETTRTVTVEVPVPVIVEPPAELMAPVPSPGVPSAFVSPDDPTAKIALTQEGFDALTGLVNELQRRLNAWRAWASTPEAAE